MALGIDSEVLSGVRDKPIQVVPTRAALGAEMHGINLKNLDDLGFATLKRAWHDHSVLLVRGQTLSDQELIAFSRRFGELDWAPIQETGRRFVEGLPEIYIVSNVKVNGEPIRGAHAPSVAGRHLARLLDGGVAARGASAAARTRMQWQRQNRVWSPLTFYHPSNAKFGTRMAPGLL
jgi:hypothetical protein